MSFFIIKTYTKPRKLKLKKKKTCKPRAMLFIFGKCTCFGADSLSPFPSPPSTAVVEPSVHDHWTDSQSQHSCMRMWWERSLECFPEWQCLKPRNEQTINDRIFSTTPSWRAGSNLCKTSKIGKSIFDFLGTFQIASDIYVDRSVKLY